MGDVRISGIGLGGAQWSLPEAMDPGVVAQVIHAALDAGVTFFDTALAYTTRDSQGHSERLLGRALRGRSDVLVATKGGHFRQGDAFPLDGRPATLRRHAESSLAALGTDCLGLYFLHWPDPSVPIEDSMGELVRLRDAGKIRMIGLSNVSTEQVERALAVGRLESVQNHCSFVDRTDQSVIELCAANGIAYVSYSPLGGASGSADLGRSAALGQVATRTGASVHQVALAWLVHHDIIPVVGARRPASIVASAAATALVLSCEDLDLLDREDPA